MTNLSAENGSSYLRVTRACWQCSFWALSPDWMWNVQSAACTLGQDHLQNILYVNTSIGDGEGENVHDTAKN